MRKFDSCQEAVDFLCKELVQRGMLIDKRLKIKAYAGSGRYVFEDRILTKSREVYHIKCRPRGRWIPKDSSKVTNFGKELDDRYKYLIRIFGKGDLSISGVNEDTILDLLEMESQGYTPYLVTIFPQTGEILWCHAYEAYDMVMRYGTLPQQSFQGMEGMTFCSIPTGWMKKWEGLESAFPTLVAEY